LGFPETEKGDRKRHRDGYRNREISVLPKSSEVAESLNNQEVTMATAKKAAKKPAKKK